LSSNAFKSGRLKRLYEFIPHRIDTKKDFIRFVKSRRRVNKTELSIIMNSEISKAVTYLKRKDPVMRKLIATGGPCELKKHKGYFKVLVRSIIDQQISVAAGRTIRKRFIKEVNGNLTPGNVLKLKKSQMKRAGISPQKMVYLKDLSRHFNNGHMSKRFNSWTDEEIREHLTQIKGIGQWTAEMFLIFVMGRLDVASPDDIGIQRAIHQSYKLKERPNRDQVMKIAEKWKPYRSVAMWYLWRAVD